MGFGTPRFLICTWFPYEQCLHVSHHRGRWERWRHGLMFLPPTFNHWPFPVLTGGEARTTWISLAIWRLGSETPSDFLSESGYVRQLRMRPVGFCLKLETAGTGSCVSDLASGDPGLNSVPLILARCLNCPGPLAPQLCGRLPGNPSRSLHPGGTTSFSGASTGCPALGAGGSGGASARQGRQAAVCHAGSFVCRF